MRLIRQHHRLLFIGLFGLGCESILGLEETPLSELDPSLDSAGGDGGRSGSVPSDEDGSSGHRRTDGGSAGNPPAAITGDARAGGAPVGDATAGGATVGGATAGDAMTGGGTLGGAGTGKVTPGGDTTGGTAAGDGSAGGAGGTFNVEPPALVVGSLQSVSDGRCVGVMSTSDSVWDVALLKECSDSDPFLRWQRDDAGRLSCVAAGGYLQVAESDVESGKVSVGLKTTNPLFQRWAFENAQLVNVAGFCIEMPFADFSSNRRATLARCHRGPAQAWTLDPSGEIQHGRQCLDVFGGVATDGQAVQTYGCQESPNQLFLFENRRLLFDRKCVGAAGTFPLLQDTQLELQTCLSGADQNIGRQQFYMEGAVEILGKCLEAGPTGELRIAACDYGESQMWRWSP